MVLLKKQDTLLQYCNTGPTKHKQTGLYATAEQLIAMLVKCVLNLNRSAVSIPSSIFTMIQTRAPCQKLLVNSVNFCVFTFYHGLFLYILCYHIISMIDKHLDMIINQFGFQVIFFPEDSPGPMFTFTQSEENKEKEAHQISVEYPTEKQQSSSAQYSLAYVQTLKNMLDELHACVKHKLDIRSCSVLAFTVTWMKPSMPDSRGFHCLLTE